MGRARQVALARRKELEDQLKVTNAGLDDSVRDIYADTSTDAGFADEAEEQTVTEIPSKVVVTPMPVSKKRSVKTRLWVGDKTLARIEDSFRRSRKNGECVECQLSFHDRTPHRQETHIRDTS